MVVNWLCSALQPSTHAVAGKLFWGPFGSPYNKRYTLPTGSDKDTDWVQQVSWKGTIDTDNTVRAKQKAQLIRRTEKPPYPPMLKYNPEGNLVVASDVTSLPPPSPTAPTLTNMVHNPGLRKAV